MASTRSEPTYSELNDVQVQDKDKLPFFRQDLDPCLVPETRDMLENYSKIPREEQLEHVHRIHGTSELGLACGIGIWLTPQLRRQTFYPEILERVKAGAVVADIGTFIGHDLRRLVYDGAPSKNLYGIDIINTFETGYEFFRDRDTFGGHFIEADFINSSASPELTALKNDKADIIIVSQVLHQWNWINQFNAAKILVEFTRPGTWVVGNQVGNVVPQAVSLPGMPTPIYRHSPDSFIKMWDEVGTATATQLETWATLRPLEDLGFDPRDMVWAEEGLGVLEFRVKRITSPSPPISDTFNLGSASQKREMNSVLLLDTAIICKPISRTNLPPVALPGSASPSSESTTNSETQARSEPSEKWQHIPSMANHERFGARNTRQRPEKLLIGEAKGLVRDGSFIVRDHFRLALRRDWDGLKGYGKSARDNYVTAATSDGDHVASRSHYASSAAAAAAAMPSNRRVVESTRRTVRPVEHWSSGLREIKAAFRGIMPQSCESDLATIEKNVAAM
ncbi:hypothetical protein CIB48_g10457 [Xylaria polymorpha]|nr:hypothetical protein CIB48_g10457 [Xylaria polymorpha]